MKKVAYYFIIVIESAALLITIVLPFIYPVIFAECWQMLLCVIFGIPLLAFVCLAVEYRNCLFSNNTSPAKNPEVEVKGSVAVKPVNTIEPDEISHIEECHDEQKCMEQDWSKAMYLRYNSLWDDVFNNIERARISLLLWDISSQTINFLKENNNDNNKVGYNADGVRMIMEDLSVNDIKLDKFYRDPTTVPVKVIAIYEWLEQQGVKESTTAFGYQLKF